MEKVIPGREMETIWQTIKLKEDKNKAGERCILSQV